MSRLCITLLGAFQATLDGEDLSSFNTDKVRALLAYLAVEAQRPHRREFLAGLLWSDQAEKKALHNLRQSLSTLRKILKEDQTQTPFLLVNRETIQFNPESNYWLDTAEFKFALDHGLPQNQQGKIQKRPNIRRLQYALSLYQGNFLDQFILKGGPLFDDWAIIQRELLTRQAIEVMCTLIDYHERREEFEKACKIAEQIVSIIPWEENAHRVVMRMLAQAGQWSAVEVQYQNNQRYLEDELGVDPSEETLALLEEIRRNAKENKALAARFSGYPHNLPLEATPFVGRKHEMIALTDSLSTPKSQCITLTGPGGIGKSRLALAVAREQLGLFEHGVFFVPLTSIDSAELLTTSIAEAIGFSFYSSQDPTTLLIDHLRQKQMLLVLDNFEHLLAVGDQAANLLPIILRNAPGVILLVTSRQPLNLRIEQIFELRGLNYPTGKDFTGINQLEEEIDYSAIRLFDQVASHVDSSFSIKDHWESVIKICQMIEGLPLGIELSASWVRGFAPEKIASQIEQNLDFLATTMRDVPDRHRSIRSVFNHSWKLLSDEEKLILQKLTVFQGSFSREAAEEITGANSDQILSLIDQSLLQRTGKDRFEMHNLLRQFTAEKLAQEPNMSQTTRDAHSNYYAKLIQGQELSLHGYNPIEAQNKISVDIENIRASWKWASEHAKIKSLDRAVKGLGRYYDMRSWFAEGREAFSRAANTLRAITQPKDEFLPVLAKITNQLGWFEIQLGNYQAAISLIEDILTELRTNDYLPELSGALNTMGSAVYELGKFDIATQYFQESLRTATRGKYLREVAFATNYLGNISRIQGKFSEANQFFERSLKIHQTMEDEWGLAKVLNNLGSIAGASGDYVEAEEYFQESLLIRRKLGDQSGIAGCLHNLSIIAYINEDFPKTKQLREECLAICREIGFAWGISSTLKHLGDVEKAQKNLAQAKIHYLESLAISEQAGDRRSIAFTLNGLGTLALLQKDFLEAEKFLKNALQTANDLELTPLTIDVLIGFAELWLEKAKYEPAYRLLGETLSQLGIEKQTQDKGEQLKTQIESHFSVPTIEHMNTSTTKKSLTEVAEEVLETLS